MSEVRRPIRTRSRESEEGGRSGEEWNRSSERPMLPTGLRARRKNNKKQMVGLVRSSSLEIKKAISDGRRDNSTCNTGVEERRAAKGSEGACEIRMSGVRDAVPHRIAHPDSPGPLDPC